MTELAGTVAVVTGASRGAGRGIALALGEAGATVYVTGRSVRGQPTTDDLPGMIEDTADAVSARGGLGIPIRCDHTDDTQVERCFARIRADQDHLDLLVNNVWGGYEYVDGENVAGDGERFGAPFWEQPLSHWDGMITAGVRAHLVASRQAAPLLFDSDSGLIVNTTFWDRDKYLGNLFYDLAKTAVNRLAYGMAIELEPHEIAAVAVSPGFMRTERVMANDPHHLDRSESTQYIGRAVRSLAADPDVLEKSGRTLAVGALSREYGFTDVDGTQPPPFKTGHDSKNESDH